MPDKPPTRSLRPAVNAAARMQEVMRRQESEDTTGSVVSLPTSSAVALPTSSENGSDLGNTTALPATISDEAPGGKADSQAALRARPSERKPPRAKKATANVTGSADSNATSSAVAQATTQTDPLKAAMLGLLAQPFPEAMKKGPMTVTSVKIPTPVWERLEFVRALTKKDKQEIIAEALLLYYEHVQRTGGEEK